MMPHTLDTLEPRALFSATPSLPVPVSPEPDATPAVNVGETPRNNSDFNLDGHNDLLLRNLRVGFNSLQLMIDGAVVDELAMRSWGDTEWRAVGVADLTGDGRPDILFRNIETGDNRIWKMNGNARIDEIDLPRAHTNWRIGGLGDFNADGHIDLMWRNLRSGRNTLWIMNNSTFIRGQGLHRLANTQWGAVGVGDFTGDGRPDILFRHQTTGANAVWRMNRVTFIHSHLIQGEEDLDWQVGEVKDFDRDGDADIVFRNLDTGQTKMWFMDRLQFDDRQDLPDYPVEWQPPGTNVGMPGSPDPSNPPIGGGPLSGHRDGFSFSWQRGDGDDDHGDLLAEATITITL